MSAHSRAAALLRLRARGVEVELLTPPPWLQAEPSNPPTPSCPKPQGQTAQVVLQKSGAC